MIFRYAYNTANILRNVSVSPQIKWALNVKFNTRKECKLFHASSVFLTTQEGTENIDKNARILKVWKGITVRDISRAMKLNLRELGLIMPNLILRPDEEIESFHIISSALKKYNWKLQVIAKPTDVKGKPKKEKIKENVSNPDNLVKRPPVVTVMGHVDHGKTTLLDSLRNSFVVQQEFGGITQHIGAFSVEVKPGEKITFIDTPGHAAFTAMRSRGAEVTDLVVLVVAADDGVMEQTLESIKIASVAEVPIIVAVNKIDKPTALPIEDIKQRLLWEGVQVEDHGGEVQLVPISALKKINLDLLTEMILAQAEIMNLRGDPTMPIEGVIIESKREPIGIVATLIVKKGTLKKEKILVAGKAYARVRKMVDENGVEYKEALPSTPVQVFGWKDLPSAGDKVFEMNTEKGAKSLIADLQRKSMIKKREAEKSIIEKNAAEHQKEHHQYKEKIRSITDWKEKKVTVFELKQEKLRKEKEVEKSSSTEPHLKVILKGDVYGSLEVLMGVLNSYNKHEECKLSIINASVGAIKTADLEMADYFGAVVYAFNVGMQENAKEFLNEKTVDIRYHNVLYKLIDDLKEELTSRIPRKDVEVINGEAEVLENFLINQGSKKVPVAGARCVKGQLNKDGLYRVLRDGNVIYEGKLAVMKNEKKIVKTVTKGMECGLMFESFPDKFKPGDQIICYDFVKTAQKTTWNPGF